jgi:hypothetical protein
MHSSQYGLPKPHYRYDRLELSCCDRCKNLSYRATLVIIGMTAFAVIATVVAICVWQFAFVSSAGPKIALPSSYLSPILNIPNIRYDVNLQPIDSHDGNVEGVAGLYYWFGMAYGGCIEPQSPSGGDLQTHFGGCADGTSPGTCGSRLDHNVTLYSSPDLVTWTPIYGDSAIILNVLQGWPQPAVMYCAKAIFNRLTNEFVLWLFWGNATSNSGYYGVMAAPKAQGPWVIITQTVMTMGLGTTELDDMNFVVEEEYPYTAYIIYTGLTATPSGPDSLTHVVVVEQMTPDYYGTLGAAEMSAPIAYFSEASAIFKRNGSYCISYGACSCYGYNDSQYYMTCAPEPLGPYPMPGVPFTAAITGQQSSIFTFWNGTGYKNEMYFADLWQTAPPPGQKGMDYNYWAPIEFVEGTNIPLPLIPQALIPIFVGPPP